MQQKPFTVCGQRLIYAGQFHSSALLTLEMGHLVSLSLKAAQYEECKEARMYFQEDLVTKAVRAVAYKQNNMLKEPRKF